VIAVSHDLHANVTHERMRAATVLCAYHTNPHRDHASTGFRATSLLIKSLRGQCRPQMVAQLCR
jgi:microcystin degradation protein MlrC